MENGYHRDDLKKELIEKGVRLLDEEGYEGFSLRKVAKECGVSHAAPYRHFKNKDELIAKIALEALCKFNQSLQGAIERYADDPRSALREMGCAYIQFFMENPEYLRLFFLSDINKRMVGSTKSHSCDEQFREGHPFYTLYSAVGRYRAVSQNPNIAAMDQEALVLYCWGLVHGISILISRKDFSCEGDIMELTRRILWCDAFLG